MNGKRERPPTDGPAGKPSSADANAARDLLKIGLGHFTAGRLDQAAALFDEALKRDPDQIDGLRLAGVVALQSGRFAQAAASLDRALALAPGDVETTFNLGLALQADGRLEEAIGRFEEVIRRKPDLAEAHLQRANALGMRGRPEEALAGWGDALRADPDCVEARFNLGLAQAQAGRVDEAIGHFTETVRRRPGFLQALALLGHALKVQGRRVEAMARYTEFLRRQPGQPDILHELAHTLHLEGRLGEAIPHYREALRLKPDFAQAWYNLANAMSATGDHQAAIGLFREAIRLRPDFADAFTDLANTLRRIDLPEEAIGCYLEALRLRPEWPETYANIANALRERGDLDRARDCLERGLALRPDFVELLNIRAKALHERGGRDEALRWLARAQALAPLAPEAHWNEALIRLAGGDLAIGWEKHETRWNPALRTPEGGQELDRPFRQPRWDGESDIKNKRVLIWREQGIGDEVMFASCLRDLIATGAKVTLEATPKLLPLFKRSFPGATIVPQNQADDPSRDDFDLHLPIGGLPRIFRRALADFNGADAYLKADPSRVDYWRGRLEALGPGPHVGLSWRSRLRTGSRAPLYTRIEDWEPVFALPGLTLVNMQYDDATTEIATVKSRFGAHLHAFTDIDMFNDLDDVAALLLALDLVISLPSAVASIAGGLGQTTWVPWIEHLGWTPLGTDRLPWYPRARLFSRRLDEPWRNVTERIGRELPPSLNQAFNTLS